MSKPNTASSIGAEYVTTKLSNVDMIAFRGMDAASVLRQRHPDNTIHRRPDAPSKAKSRFNILLNILQSPYIAIMFLRAVFSMFALQTIFFHVYHLKDDIELM